MILKYLYTIFNITLQFKSTKHFKRYLPLLLLISASNFLSLASSSKNSSKNNQCYCQLSNKKIHDTNCLCNVKKLVKFNEQQILPSIEKVIKSDYFRYFKVDVNKGCSYWNEPYHCSSNQCGLTHCLPTDLPPAFNQDLTGDGASSSHEEGISCNEANEEKIIVSELSNLENQLGLDQDEENYIFDEQMQMTSKDIKNMHSHWDKYDENDFKKLKNKNLQQVEKLTQSSQNARNSRNSDSNFSENDSSQSSSSQNQQKQLIWEKEFMDWNEKDGNYYDLLKNPERYTGYAGEASHRVWRKIYEENCYAETESKTLGSQILNDFNKNLIEEEKDQNWWRKPNEVISELDCVEKRVFFRAVSGLHSSISLHLVKMWYFADEKVFKPNLPEFIRRFEHENGRQYIHNLYFVWLMELRALQKASKYLINAENIREVFFTGDVISDIKDLGVAEGRKRVPAAKISTLSKNPKSRLSQNPKLNDRTLNHHRQI